MIIYADNCKNCIRQGHCLGWYLKFLITVMVLHLGTSNTSSAYFTTQYITLFGNNVPLRQIFTKIEQQTGYTFVYSDRIMKKSNRVTINVTQVTLVQALEAVFSQQPFSYEIVESVIVVKDKNAGSDRPESKLAGTLMKITGKVTDSSGEPLIAASIMVERTRNWTQTDVEGDFKLSDLNDSDIVLVTYTGYEPQRARVGTNLHLAIILEIARSELDEVIFQAYGKTTRRLSTGNIAKITSDEILKQPVINPIQAIQGLAPGSVLTNTSGYASGTVKIEIRGRKTINPGIPSDPLYIIDGVPLTVLNLVDNGKTSYDNGSQGFIQSGILSPANGQSPFFSLNPADIESIEVLKDADATAIYGSRAANGVILITTKNGKAGKTKTNINVSSGITQVVRHYKMLNTQQYVEMRREALKNDSQQVNMTNAPDLIAWDTTRYTDWQGYLWGNTGKYTNVHTSISGGDTRTSFRIAAGFNYLTEILTNSGSSKRTSLSANITHKSRDQKLNIALTGIYSRSNTDMINVPSFPAAILPHSPAVYSNEGNLNYGNWEPLSNLYRFGSLLQPYKSGTDFLNSNLNVRWQILKGLVIKTDLGYNYMVNSQQSLTPIISQNPRGNPTGRSEFGNTILRNIIVEPQLEYNSVLFKGKINILLGASAQNNTTSANAARGSGYTNDVLLNSVSNAPVQSSLQYEGQYKYAAIFSRVNYNWHNKYIVNLNFRRDGSSRFGPGKQFGNFYSLGGAWIFTEESWVRKSIRWLKFGKIRASYGTTGSDQVPDYSYLTQWQFSPFPYNGSQLLYPVRHTDSLIHWQVNQKTEFSLLLSILSEKLSFEISWYRDLCKDQLIYFPTPGFTGFGDVISNTPARVQNRGWEFIINASLGKKHFNWSAKFMIGINNNKLVSYPDFNQSPYVDLFVIGKPLNILRLLHWTGVDPQTGLYTFEDRDKNGVINIDYSGKPDDRYVVDLSPKLDGSFSNSFTWKKWALSFMLYFKNQKGRNALITLSNPGTMANQPVEIMNRWKKPGDITDVARFTTQPFADPSFQNFLQRSDGVYTDASFIRLQNVTISYAIINGNPKSPFFDNLRISLQGQNLFCITKYKGIDPEVQNFGGLPRARIITMGIICEL